jgi:hypothetical protein
MPDHKRSYLRMHAAVDNAALLLPEDIILAIVSREAPVSGLDDLLASRELKLGTTKSLRGLHRN